MIEKLLTENESKTLEFKENAQSKNPIIKTVIAFANTSGGNIVIGVRDGTKEIIGIENILNEEERLTNIIAETIRPLIVPDIQIVSIRNRELLIIKVPFMVGPFHLKSVGIDGGTYIRLGSSSRKADEETILSLRMLAKNISFDELPCINSTLSDLHDDLIIEKLSRHLGNITKKQYESLGIVARHHNKLVPTNGAILLFGIDRFQYFPDSNIFCVSFSDETREHIIDQQEIRSPLILAMEEILTFVKRFTKTLAIIGEIERKDIPQYPYNALREAIINAIVHADYSSKGTSIQVAIFSNRIEITNPGGLTYGQSLELALSGVSKMRNRMIGRIFRETKLIERLGTGLGRILAIYGRTNVTQPIIEELNSNFRVTLFSTDIPVHSDEKWQDTLISALNSKKELGTQEIAKLWKVTTRTARNRLNKLVDLSIIYRFGTSHKDPRAVYRLR